MRSAGVKCPPNQEVALYSLCFRTHYPIGGLEISGKVEVAHCSTPKPSEYIHNANIANANANEMQQNATRCLRYKAKMSKAQLERLKHYFWAPLPFSCCCLNKQHTQKTMSSKNREAAKKTNKRLSVSHSNSRSEYSENIHPEEFFSNYAFKWLKYQTA